MKKNVFAVLVAAAFVTAQVSSAEEAVDKFLKNPKVSKLQNAFKTLKEGIENLAGLEKNCTKQVGQVFGESFAQLSKATEDKEKVESKHAALKAEHSELEKKHSDLTAEIEMVSQERRDLQDRHDTLVVRHEELREALEGTNSRLQNEQIENMKIVRRQEAAHRKALAEKYETYKKALEEKDREHKAALEAKEEELKVQFASLTRILMQAREELQKPAPNITVVKSDIDNAVKQLTLVSADIDEVENLINEEVLDESGSEGK
jgi:chromosome segregation ATPase